MALCRSKVEYEWLSVLYEQVGRGVQTKSNDPFLTTAMRKTWGDDLQRRVARNEERSTADTKKRRGPSTRQQRDLCTSCMHKNTTYL